MTSMVEMGVIPHVQNQIIQDNSLEREKRVAAALRTDPPTWKGNAPSIALDGLQIARNIFSSTSQYGPTCRFVVQSGFIPGVIWALMGANESRQGWKDWNQSESIQDKEGVCRAKTRLMSGALGTGGALFYLAKNATDFIEVAEAVSTGLDMTSSALFGIGSVIGMSMASVGLYRIGTFRAKINRRLEDATIQSEAARCLNTLQFLKEQIVVSDSERNAIQDAIKHDHPHASLEKINELIDESLIAKTQAKMKHFKRRTTQKSLGLVLNQIEPIMAKLEKGEGVQEARELIREIKKENFKKGALYFVALVAGAIGFAALIAGTFFTLGALPFILGAISSAIFLAMTLSAHAQNYFDRGAAPEMGHAHHHA